MLKNNVVYREKNPKFLKFEVIEGKKKESKFEQFWEKFDLMSVVLLLMLLFISINIVSSINVEVRLMKQKNMLLNDYQNTEKEQLSLKKEIAFYNSNKGIEKIARERLGFIKQDEVPVRYLFSK